MPDETHEPPPQRQQEAEERWERILQSSNDAFVGMGEDGRITDWNPRAEEMFGWPAEDAIGRDLAATLIPPEFRERHHRGLASFLTEGAGTVLFRSLEVPALHRSGRRVPVELRIWPTRAGARWQFYALLRDLSEQERMRARMALLERVTVAANQTMDVEEAVRAALTEICAMTRWPVGHAYLTEPGNPALLQPSGWWELAHNYDGFVKSTAATSFAAGDGLPGRVLEAGRPSWADLLTDESSPRASAALADGLRSAFAFPVLIGEHVAAVLEFFTPDEVDADAELLDLCQHVGAQLGRVFERRWALDELIAAAETKSRMMSVLAHEIRTPLATLKGFADLIRNALDELSPSEVRDFADSIERTSTRLQRLVTNHLAAAQAEAGRLDVRPREIGLRPAVEQVVTDLALDEVEVEMTEELAARVDNDHLLQILTNLLSNADKYGRPPLRVRAEALNDHVRLEISDRGPGIPDGLASQLFEPFARGSLGKSKGGSGLGLWISRELARRNGGELAHEASAAGGATFVLTLPSPEG